MFGRHHRLSVEAGSIPDSRVARHVEALTAWRRRSFEEQWLALGSGDSLFSPGDEPASGRIRLGLFCPCLGLGGAEAWQLALIRAIDRRVVVWRGAVVTDGRHGVAPEMLKTLSGQISVGFGWKAAQMLAEVSDVIISWSVLDYEGLFRGIDHPPRVIQACHFPGEMPWTVTAEELLAKIDRLVAVSELAVESIPASLRDQVKIVWNAVDGPRLSQISSPEQTRASWGLPAEAKVVGYLGRLSPEKDPDAMLRLATHLPEPWHIVVVGDGRERQAMTEKVARLGLSRVRLIPGTNEVGDVLAAFDSLVVPSWFESFGLTMAEGFWAGIPVIATHSGLARIVPGLVREVGFVPSGAELADAVLTDHDSDIPARIERVARARTFARERLDLARFGADWTRLVQDLARLVPSTSKEESCRPTSLMR